MKPKVTTVDVWAASIEDRVGGLAEKLTALTAAGSNLEFVLAHQASMRSLWPNRVVRTFPRSNPTCLV
jgi:hypothetical protein